VTHTYTEFSKNPRAKTSVFTISSSSADTPPKRQDSSVEEECTISCNFDKPFEDWEPVRNNSEGYKKYDDLVLTMHFEGEPRWEIRAGKNKEVLNFRIEYGG
jgi:hypothetical protein